MIKRIILHIGAPKTASTSIQRSIRANVDVLEKAGIMVVEEWPTNNSSMIQSMFFKNKEAVRCHVLNQNDEEDIQEINQNAVLALDTKINSSDLETLLISGEGIYDIPPRIINKMKRYFENRYGVEEFSILYFVRNPVSYYTSLCQQYLKNGRGTISDFMVKQNFLIYKAVIRKFAAVFGDDSIKVCQFEEACNHPYGPVGYFLGSIGIAEEDLPAVDYVHANTSISDMACDIINTINTRLPMMMGDMLMPGRFMTDTTLINKIEGQKFAMTPEEREIIYEASLEDAKYLQNHYQIDYLGKPSLKPIAPFVFDERYAETIRSIFNGLSPVIQKLLYEYVEEKAGQPELTDKDRHILSKLAGELKQRYPVLLATPVEELATKLSERMRREQELFSKLSTSQLMHASSRLASQHHMMSVYLKQNRQYGGALFFARKAAQYMPISLQIQENCRQLEERVSHPVRARMLPLVWFHRIRGLLVAIARKCGILPILKNILRRESVE